MPSRAIKFLNVLEVTVESAMLFEQLFPGSRDVFQNWIEHATASCESTGSIAPAVWIPEKPSKELGIPTRYKACRIELAPRVRHMSVVPGQEIVDSARSRDGQMRRISRFAAGTMPRFRISSIIALTSLDRAR